MQVQVVRTFIPRVKHTPLSYALKVVLFGALWFSMWREGQLLFQILPYSREGAYLSEVMSPAAIGIFAVWFFPAVTALIYFGLYHLFVRYCYNNLCRTMSVFGQKVDGAYVHVCASAAIAVGALIKGGLSFVYTAYPLIVNVAEPLLGFVVNAAVMAALYLLIARKFERAYRPFAFSSMMLAMAVYLIIL